MRKPAAPKIAERDVLKSIQDYAATVLKITLHRRNTGMTIARYGGKTRAIRYGKKGASDLFGYVKPYGVGIECEIKRLGEVPSQEQADWLEERRQEGCVAFWADSLDQFIGGMKLEYQKRDWHWPG